MQSNQINFTLVGEVAERSKAAVLKTVELERAPGVRIPPSPPIFNSNKAGTINGRRCNKSISGR